MDTGEWLTLAGLPEGSCLVTNGIAAKKKNVNFCREKNKTNICRDWENQKCSYGGEKGDKAIIFRDWERQKLLRGEGEQNEYMQGSGEPKHSFARRRGTKQVFADIGRAKNKFL